MEVIDVEGLRKMSGYDEDFVTEILKLYTERSSRDMEELTAARTKQDPKAVKFVVHRMRSAAVPLGLKELVILLKRVELALEADQDAVLNDELDKIEKITRAAIENARDQLNIA